MSHFCMETNANHNHLHSAIYEKQLSNYPKSQTYFKSAKTQISVRSAPPPPPSLHVLYLLILKEYYWLYVIANQPNKLFFNDG